MAEGSSRPTPVSVYERTFGLLCAHLAEPVLDAGGVGPCTRVLDVGTGPGTLAVLAIARHAEVQAVDPDPGMVAVARRRVPRVQPGALPDLPFGDDEFDAVVANFVVNHIDEPIAGTHELARVTAPGGRVALTIWPDPPAPLHRLWGEALEVSGVQAPPVWRHQPVNDFERSPDGLRDLLTPILSEVHVERVEWTHQADPEEWWSGPASGLSPFGQLLSGLPRTDVDRIHDAYRHVSRRYRNDNGWLALPAVALLASGRKGVSQP